MTEREFYITLSSDSSLQYYPNNTTSRFTVKLPKALRLDEEWTVGLCEVQFPNSFLHLTKNDAHIKFTHKGNKTPPISVDCMLPYGIYPDVDSLIRAINRNSLLSRHFLFTYDKVTSFVMIKRICKGEECIQEGHTLILTEKLARILGFDHVWSGIEFANLMAKVGSQPASLARGLPENLFIYTDICSSHIVGDIRTPLLRIVPYNSAAVPYGANYSATFSPFYFPLLQTSFQTIEIDIRDKFMNLIPFERGPLLITLHFKRSNQ